MQRRVRHAYDDARALARDVEALVAVDAAVVSLSSNVGRLVAELRYARLHRDPLTPGARTLVSVDKQEWYTDP